MKVYLICMGVNFHPEFDPGFVPDFNVCTLNSTRDEPTFPLKQPTVAPTGNHQVSSASLISHTSSSNPQTLAHTHAFTWQVACYVSAQTDQHLERYLKDVPLLLGGFWVGGVGAPCTEWK